MSHTSKTPSYAIKTPNGFLRSIDADGTIEECKSIYSAEWYRTSGLAFAVVCFLLSQLPAHKRFSVYSFKLPHSVMP